MIQPSSDTNIWLYEMDTESHFLSTISYNEKKCKWFVQVDKDTTCLQPNMNNFCGLEMYL